MAKSLSLVAIILLLAGCAEMHVKCRGKGTITVNAMMYGGTIQGDCGDGFEYERKSTPSPKAE